MCGMGVPAGAPRLHPRSPAHYPPAARRSGGGGHAGCFSCGGRRGTHQPGLGPLPIGPQADHGRQPWRRRQLTGPAPVLVTDSGEQFQGPVALRLTKVARTLLPERWAVLPLPVRQHRGHPPGHMQPRPQTVRAPFCKGLEPRGRRLACTPQWAGYRGGRDTLSARQQHLAAPYRKGIQGTTTASQGGARLLREWSDTLLWLHGRDSMANLAFCPMTLLKTP